MRLILCFLIRVAFAVGNKKTNSEQNQFKSKNPNVGMVKVVPIDIPDGDKKNA